MATQVYLLSGDDGPKLDAWRSRLRRRAEEAGGPGALETFDARSDSPDAVAAALSTLTLTTSDRFVLVDGVDAWKAGDLDTLERELQSPAESTILLLVAYGKPSARLVKAVEQGGGEHRECNAPKPWEMPRWAAERAREEGLILDKEAAKMLVACVGTRQQRIMREIEKLVVAAHPGTQLSAEEVRSLVAGDFGEKAYALADALVAGDTAVSIRLAEQLVSSGERPSGLAYPIVRRLRDVQRVSELLDAGVPEKRAQGSVKMPPWQWKRIVAQAKKADRDALENALCAFSELEVELRGGGVGLDEETAFSLTLARAEAGR